jgi:hypothetical protein
MLGDRAKIPAVGAMDRPGATDAGLLMNNDVSARRCERRFVEVECSVELCVGGQL